MCEAIARKTVTTIPATLNRFTATPILTKKERRVAAYARVSTDDEEQQSSYESQISHYTRYIQEHEGWVFAGMFSDEGISGTDTKHRDGFNAMIRSALAGEIDLILTKSVSRFARNTVDTLTTVRKLKAIGVEVCFEKEQIYTLDSKGELLITIMSSLAQEESRSISENVTWGMRKRFADGKVLLPYKHFLGYRKGGDGLPEIVPEEAETVRLIYRMYMEGKSPSFISRYLSDQGIPSPAGKSKWRPNTVQSILTNEKYKGDALLQKTFRTDFLTKKSKINEGEVAQYYVGNSHPAIIEPAIYDAVQVEMKKRAHQGHRNYTPHAFSGKIFCSECGGLYGSDVCHHQVVWRCNNRHRKNTQCRTPAIRNRIMEDAFVMAINRAIEQKEDIISICEAVMTERCDTSKIDTELTTQRTRLDAITTLMENCIHNNARTAIDQGEYTRLFSEYEVQSTTIQASIASLKAQKTALIAKRNNIQNYIAILRSQGRIARFSETLWLNCVERVWINPDGTMKFDFRGGPSIEG